MDLPPLLKASLERFLEGSLPFYWQRDERVYADIDWSAFESSLTGSTADLIATEVRSYAEDPAWDWWSSLKHGGLGVNLSLGVAALMPLARYSRRAAEVVLSASQAGWTGHPEALIPTLVNVAGLAIEDVGGSGSFTPEGRKGRWYDKRTWHWKGPVEFVPDKLHFPVIQCDQRLARARINELPPDSRVPRILFVLPVGAGAVGLHETTLPVFLGSGAACLFIQYDDAELNLPPEVRILKDRGKKWELAGRHLDPAQLEDFDYLFYWDDDLDVTGFDAFRFVEIMRQNRLEMAQPAITSPHWICHEITARHPCPPPRLGPSGSQEYAVVGRLTNFVEIMAPVFTRQGWCEFYSYLDPANTSGWGYDYIPLGRKGIVDALSVVHTRPVQSICEDAEAEITRFIASQGLARHGTVNQGALFERS